MKTGPDFLIIGAAKAGTTALYRYLQQHPKIYFSPLKEPHYFSADIDPARFNSRYYKNSMINLEKYFRSKTLKPVFLAFVRKKEYYERLFEMARHDQVKGEASTSYLYSEEAAANIHNTIPEVKLIAVLRDPAERTYSHYLMARKFGFTSKSFLDAVKEDQRREYKGWGISELYIELSRYYHQLKRYYDLFPEKQIKIILHEDLKRDPGEVLNEICHFLGIKKFSFDTGNSHNVAGMPRFDKINVWLNRLGLRLKLGNLIPEGLKGMLRKIYLKEDNIPPLKEEEKQYLRGQFAEEVKQTAKLTGLDLRAWLR